MEEKINLIKRDLFSELKSHLCKKEISLIIGSRQVGKTTLILILKEWLDKKGEKTFSGSFTQRMLYC